MIKSIRRKTDILDFGKHKGETIRSILESDPGYILWLDEENICEISQEIIDAAQDNLTDLANDMEY